MDYAVMFELIQKPWIDTNGIMKLAQCGKYSATKIRVDIENKILDSGKKLPLSSRKNVPTKMVLDYLGFDEDYIYNMANKEKRV